MVIIGFYEKERHGIINREIDLNLVMYTKILKCFRFFKKLLKKNLQTVNFVVILY